MIPQSSRAEWALTIVGLCILMTVTLTVYWPGLSDTLVLDDEPNLAPLRDMANGSIDWFSVVTGNDSGLLGRPISMLTFVLNTAVSGFSAGTFKFTNLVIHLLTGILAFGLAGRLYRETGNREPWRAALFMCALWLLAPMFVSTVLYAIQRMAQLSTLFVFAGLFCYVLGRQLATTKPRSAFCLVASAFVVWTPVAMLSKENGVLLPLLALTIEAAFFRLSGPESAKRYVKILFIVFLAVPAVGVTLWLIFNPDFLLAGYRHRDFTLTERVLTEPRILLSYLRGLLIPNGPSLGLYHDDYPRSVDLISPWSTLPAVLLWTAAIAWFLTTSRGQTRYLLFGPIFFLAAQSLESGIFPLELYFEHRNYLAGFGIYFGASLALERIGTKYTSKRLLAMVMVTLPIAFSAATYQRASNWQSWHLLVLSNSEQHPESSRLRTELASLYFNSGDMPTAMRHLEAAVSLNPTMETGAMLHAQLGRCITGAPYEANIALTAPAQQLNVYTVTALEQLANFVDEHECEPRIIHQSVEMVMDWLDDSGGKTIPYAWKVRFNLARLLYASGQVDDAVGQLKEAGLLAPQRLEPQLLAARYQLETGKINQARQTLKQLKTRDRGDRKDLTRLLETMLQLTDELTPLWVH